MDYVQKIDKTINDTLIEYVQKPTLIRGIVHLLLMLYVVRIAPTPPVQVLILFDNVFFKLFVFSLVLWTAQFSPSTSILITLAFMVTINFTTRGKFGINGVFEMLDNVPATPINAIQAVQVLGQMAATETAVSPEVVETIKQVALSASTTPESVTAINNLAEQAMQPSMAPVEVVNDAVQVATADIVANMPTPNQVVSAIQTLSEAALTPSPVPESVIAPIANIALSGMTTPSAIQAIQALSNQAVSPSAGTPNNVSAAAEIAIANVAQNTPESPMSQMTPTPTSSASTEQAIEAVKALASAAISPNAISASDVSPVANVVASAVSTPAGLQALQSLAEQSIVPEAGTNDKVTEAVQIVLADIKETAAKQASPEPASAISDSLPAAAPSAAPITATESQKQHDAASGCYPIRQYDMSKVSPMSDGGKISFEDWQNFTSTLKSS